MMLASPRFHVQRRRATMAVAWCAPLVLTMLMSLGATDAYAVADPSAIAAGKYLADIGGCESCHTAPNGKPAAIDFAKHRRSASTPLCSHANIVPVRPKPV